MPAEKWTADVIAHPRVAAFTHIDLHGPELDDHDLDLVDRLASDLFDEFCEYVAARNAVKLALVETGAPSQHELDRVAQTRDELFGEIDSGLLLQPAEGQIVAELLGAVTARIGTERKAA